MNKKLLFLNLFNLFMCTSCYGAQLKDGDIIFQTSSSRQSVLLEKVTESKYTHVGIIINKNSKLYVAEASSTVRYTPLDKWISKGKFYRYLVMRDESLQKNSLDKIKSYINKQIGKNYDFQFGWSDNKFYCSELVWKAYKNASIQLTETKLFRDFNLTSEVATRAIRTRFQNIRFNLDEKVVAPVDLYESSKLKIVYSNYIFN